MLAPRTRSGTLIGLLGLVFCGCENAATAPDGGTPPDGGTAELVLDQPSVNVGEVDVGGAANALLGVRNTGTATAQIQRVRITGSGEVRVVGDSCTGVLEPAHSCAVTLAIEPALAGAVAADVAIETSAGVLASRITATGRALVTVEPIGSAGQVTSEPAGITCGAGAIACRAAFTVPRVVLRASDDVTVRWAGACVGHATCELVLDQSPAVTATMFAPLVVTLAEPTTRFALANGVAIDRSNRMIVTGERPGEVTGVAFTGVLEPDGRIAWTDRFDPGAEGHDTGHAVATDAAGNVYIAGQWFSASNTRFNAFIRKLSPTGAYVWGRENEDVGDDGYRGITIDPISGAIYVVGFRPDPTDIGLPIHSQGWIRRLDTLGQPVWSRTWQGSADGDDLALAVALDASGNVIVVGKTATTAHGADAWIASYSPDGDLQWSDLRGGETNDEASAVAVAANGTVIVAGTQAGAGWIARYSASHQRIDELATPEVPGWQGAALDAEGALVVTGGDQTRVFTPTLQPVWSRTGRELHAQDVAFDLEGNVVVIGSVDNDITIIKYFQ